MRNVLFGYLFARATAGERAARTGLLVVMLAIGFLLGMWLGGPVFRLFRDSFMKGVREGQQSWDRAEQTERTPR